MRKLHNIIFQYFQEFLKLSIINVLSTPAGAGFIGKGRVEEWGANNFIVVPTPEQPAPTAHGNTR